MDAKLLNRISKLLALGNGTSFDGEADASLQKAYALMQEHNISMAQVEGASREAQLGPLEEQVLSGCGQPTLQWEQVLFNNVAHLFDCDTVYCHSRIDWNRNQTLAYILGREGNRITAVLMYKWLHDKIHEQSYAYSGRSGKLSYCVGAALGIAQKVRELKAKESKTDAWGIVPYDEVKDLMRRLHPNMFMSDHNFSVGDAAAYRQGHQDGKDTNLNRQFAQQALPCA